MRLMLIRGTPAKIVTITRLGPNGEVLSRPTVTAPPGPVASLLNGSPANIVASLVGDKGIDILINATPAGVAGDYEVAFAYDGKPIVVVPVTVLAEGSVEPDEANCGWFVRDN